MAKWQLARPFAMITIAPAPSASRLLPALVRLVTWRNAVAPGLLTAQVSAWLSSVLRIVVRYANSPEYVPEVLPAADPQ
jgi:hypothetical protein